MLLSRDTIFIRVHLWTVCKAVGDVCSGKAVRIWEYGEVNLREECLHSERGDGFYGVVVLADDFLWSVFKNHVSLHSNGVDWKSFLYQWAEELADSFYLCRLVHREVVIIEFYGRVCLTCVLESKRNIIFT